MSAAPRGWRRVDAPERPVLFVNPRSGDGKATKAGLVVRAREQGVKTVVLSEGQSLEALARDAAHSGADALGMAGGDGSLATVAAIARAHELPFVCIPAGTRNHFALDVGVDRRDLLGALDAFTDGIERSVDVAEVNERMFLNNVSLGIYGDAVHRPGYRDAKLRTLLETADAVLGPSETTSGIELVDDTGRTHSDPAILLVSNNPYALNRPLVRGTRPTLAAGRLGVLVLDRPGIAEHERGRAWSARGLEVSSEGVVHSGIDGEAVELVPPLSFTTRPRALRVRISAKHPGVSPSGMLDEVRQRLAVRDW